MSEVIYISLLLSRLSVLSAPWVARHLLQSSWQCVVHPGSHLLLLLLLGLYSWLHLKTLLSSTSLQQRLMAFIWHKASLCQISHHLLRLILNLLLFNLAVSHVEIIVNHLDRLVVHIPWSLLLGWFNVLLHFSFEGFYDGLSLADVTTSSDRWALLDCVVGKHVVVRFSFELVTLSAHLLLFGYYAQTLWAV